MTQSSLVEREKKTNRKNTKMKKTHEETRTKAPHIPVRRHGRYKKHRPLLILPIIMKQHSFGRDEGKSNGQTKGNRFGARATFASSIVSIESHQKRNKQCMYVCVKVMNEL